MNIDLKRFCTPKEKAGRYPELAAPFRVGGYVYATNGFAVIRMPASSMPDASPAGDKSTAQDLIHNLRHLKLNGEFLPLSEDRIQDGQGCDACGGSGRQDAEFEEMEDVCDACDGTGETECEHCWHVGGCQECDGEGMIVKKVRVGELGSTKPCVECHGIGRQSDFVDGIEFDACMVAAIRELPSVEAFVHRGPHEHCMRFSFAGGEGALIARSIS